ncbi:glycosyltransferase family 4 protein [Bradyrhizobium sp. 930_D9_N1_4]|uniref:glycosyltransferase family 4 protein n=1 Tax=Bradyrhizobium sp. 930_D9_N1_4 TaxID=3240374 RepID=UPI003F8BA531
MKVLILGGSPARPGGVEAFCSRAYDAVNLEARLEVDWLPTNTAYLRPATAARAWQSLLTFWRRHNEGWNVVWLQYVNLADLVFLLVARAMGLKVIVTPHLGANWKSTRIAMLRALSRALLGLSSKFAYLSETQLQELALPVGVPRCRIHTFLPRSIGTRRLVVESRAGRQGLRLIHAGRLSHEKGSFLFLEACAGLKQRNVAFTADVIGGCDDDTRTALNKRIVEYGLEENVTLFPAMDEEALMKRLATADFLVHLSVLDSFPLIVLEALAAGAYPICIDLPGARKMTEDYCGRVVPQQTAVQAVVDILCRGDLEVVRREADAVRNKVLNDYDWSTCVRMLESCIEQD